MPGIHFSQRLTAIEPDWTPSAESAIGEGREDIGSRTSAIDELPRSPDEPPAGPLGRMAAAVKQQLTKLLHGSGQRPDGPDDKGQLPDDAEGQAADESSGGKDKSPAQHSGETTSVELAMGDWPADVDSQSTVTGKPTSGLGRISAGVLGATAGVARAAGQALAGAVKRLAQLGQRLHEKTHSPGRLEGRPPRKPTRKDEKLSEKRHRETLRLLHALETDPDRGLRDALPFNQGNRDAGRQGSKLLFHDVDFSLQRLAGGRPVDHWDLPQHVRQQLLAKYHESAGRELRLGAVAGRLTSMPNCSATSTWPPPR